MPTTAEGKCSKSFHGEDIEGKIWMADAPARDGVEYLAEELHDHAASRGEVQSTSTPEDPSDGKNPLCISLQTSEDRIACIDREQQERVLRRRNDVNTFQRWFGYFLPYGGVISSGINLASSCLGAGIVALPSAFNSSGVIMALIYMVAIASLTVYSYVLLATAAKRTGLRNYEQIVRTLLGPGADYFLAFCLWFLSFGAEVSYTISVKDIVTAYLGDSESTPKFLHNIWGQRLLTTVVWLVFMLPLCLPKEINSLRYFSFIAVCFVVYFAIAMIVHSCTHGLQQDPRPPVKLFNTGNAAIGGFATFLYTFISQLNAMEVAGEMYKFSVSRMTLAATVGVGICFVLYFFASIFGYLDFGAEVTDSVLKKYDPIHDKMMGIGYAGLMLKLCVGYGLHMIPVRDAIYHVFRTSVREVSWGGNACVCGSMAVLSLVAGLLLPRIKLVFGLVGGFSGGFIAYIYPALMVMYLGNWSIATVGWSQFIATYMLLIVGVIAVVWGTSSALHDEIIEMLK